MICHFLHTGQSVRAITERATAEQAPIPALKWTNSSFQRLQTRRVLQEVPNSCNRTDLPGCSACALDAGVWRCSSCAGSLLLIRAINACGKQVCLIKRLSWTSNYEYLCAVRVTTTFIKHAAGNLADDILQLNDVRQASSHGQLSYTCVTAATRAFSNASAACMSRNTSIQQRASSRFVQHQRQCLPWPSQSWCAVGCRIHRAAGCPAGTFGSEPHSCRDCPKGSFCSGGRYTGEDNSPPVTPCSIYGPGLTTLGVRTTRKEGCGG